jgi:hypothetical protein
MTPGCTTEVCAFRDRQAKMKRHGAVVLGVSPDSPASHAKFADKYRLSFPLLADPEAKVAQKYGVWKERSLYGRTFMGIERSTRGSGFLGDALTGAHAEVLAGLRALEVRGRAEPPFSSSRWCR